MSDCPPGPHSTAGVAGVRAFAVVWLHRVVQRRDGNDPNGAGAFREEKFFLSAILLELVFFF